MCRTYWCVRLCDSLIDPIWTILEAKSAPPYNFIKIEHFFACFSFSLMYSRYFYSLKREGSGPNIVISKNATLLYDFHSKVIYFPIHSNIKKLKNIWKYKLLLSENRKTGEHISIYKFTGLWLRIRIRISLDPAKV